MTEITQDKIEQLHSYVEEVNGKDNSESYLIAVLHKVQALFGYLPKDIMDDISEKMQIPSAHIWGVATFYHYFNLKPVGKHVISVCMGTACYVKGADKILDAIRKHLNIEVGETTEDKVFTLHEARCLGACGIAPVIMVDDKIYGELDSKKTVDLLEKYRSGSI